ncbi:DUF4148 domain-containing protein [Paraburkholderia sp. J12]|uniref:DUF4148 domain-containing protein n=1 Tax=Paraburkholderia sp. J12 TaxID=2805432 RepID=UPI002ABE211B|nr:DUF4148 domain-containing protein [Paraburkholderia sp. J12]
MKSLWNGAGVALLLSVSALAHAQGVANPPVNAQTNAQAYVAQQAADTSSAQADSTNGSLTRAQVYHQLVQAERDGQLQTLNQTVYAHH